MLVYLGLCVEGSKVLNLKRIEYIKTVRRKFIFPFSILRCIMWIVLFQGLVSNIREPLRVPPAHYMILHKITSIGQIFEHLDFLFLNYPFKPWPVLPLTNFCVKLINWPSNLNFSATLCYSYKINKTIIFNELKIHWIKHCQ